MRLYPNTELDIGINETRANFLIRLTTQQRAQFTHPQIQAEAAYQTRFRDIEMATTVNQLKPVLLEMLTEVAR